MPYLFWNLIELLDHSYSTSNKKINYQSKASLYFFKLYKAIPLLIHNPSFVGFN